MKKESVIARLLAAVEHAEHEVVTARARLAALRAEALREAGWTQYVYTSPYYEGDVTEADVLAGVRQHRRRRWGAPTIYWAPPGAKRVHPHVKPFHDSLFPGVDRGAEERAKKLWKYEPSYLLHSAWLKFCRESKRLCGPLSCERPPLGRRRRG